MFLVQEWLFVLIPVNIKNGDLHKYVVTTGKRVSTSDNIENITRTRSQKSFKVSLTNSSLSAESLEISAILLGLLMEDILRVLFQLGTDFRSNTIRLILVKYFWKLISRLSNWSISFLIKFKFNAFSKMKLFV